jgi:hypothetical protein
MGAADFSASAPAKPKSLADSAGAAGSIKYSSVCNEGSGAAAPPQAVKIVNAMTIKERVTNSLVLMVLLLMKGISALWG